MSVRNINICGRILTQFTSLLRTNTVAAKRNLLAERTGLGKSVSVSLRKNGPWGRSYPDFFPASRLRFGWVTSHLSLFPVKKKCDASHLSTFLRVDLNPRILKICASWMSVWNISANYVSVPLKFNLNWNIWKPFLKTSPLHFSGQRLGNTSLVVFLRFHSFSQVVKWPEFVRLYTTNISHVQCQISLTDRGPLCLREVMGSLSAGPPIL